MREHDTINVVGLVVLTWGRRTGIGPGYHPDIWQSCAGYLGEALEGFIVAPPDEGKWMLRLSAPCTLKKALAKSSPAWNPPRTVAEASKMVAMLGIGWGTTLYNFQ